MTMDTFFNDFTVIFIGILLEALPFVLIGSLISSAVGVFVSDETFYKLLPKNKIVGLFVAAFIGLVLPVCDCTVIPVVRRLIKKGLPTSLGVTFMCAVPIVNPTVIAATAWAFTGLPHMLWLRIICGLVIAISAGAIIGLTGDKKTPLRETVDAHKHDHCCSCGDHHDCGDEHENDHIKQGWVKLLLGKFGDFLTHTSTDFVESGALVILGAMIAAFVNVEIPRSVLYPISGSPTVSVAGMMSFGYLISLCSNADAFIERSLYGQFTAGSLIAFMTFGPMIDFKNTIMLLGFFKKRFVLHLTAVLVALCFACGVIINIFRV